VRGETTGLHRLTKVDAVDKFHEQVKKAPGLAEVMDGNDVRMIEAGEDASFTIEPLGKGGIGSEGLREKLESHHAVELGLTGLIDDAHAALSDEIEDFEMREGGGDGLHGRWWVLGRRLAGIGRAGGGREYAFGAEPLRGIGRQLGLTLWTAVGTRLSIHVARFLRNSPGEVTRNRGRLRWRISRVTGRRRRTWVLSTVIQRD
jgi:hypothetical protein